MKSLEELYKSYSSNESKFTSEAKKEGYSASDIGVYWNAKKDINKAKTKIESSPINKEGLSVVKALSDSKQEFGKISELELVKIDDYLNRNKNNSTILKELLKDVNGQLAVETQLRTDINEKIGISGQLSKGLRDEILDSQPAAIEFGYGISDITTMITSMMEKSGRFNLISRETIDKSFATARAFVGNYEEMGALFNEFERVGIGARGAMESIDKAGKDSLSLGLRAKTTVSDIRTNIEKLNEYGFKNGIQGLAEMSRKASEFRINMSKVFDIAEKVMDPDAALSLTANLQVLGGAIGDFNDPLKLMNMATNNVEDLTDSLIGAAQGLATYNSEQGRFEVTNANLRRARDMSKELGMTTGELTKVAIAAQERLSATMDLASRGFDIKEEDKRFITNLSKMDKGRMVIEVPESLSDKFKGQTQIALSDLTKEQIAVLNENKKAFEQMSPTDIAKDQLSTQKNIERIIQGYARENIRAVTKGADIQTDLDKLLRPVMNEAKEYGKANKLSSETIAGLKENIKNEVYKGLFSGGLPGATDVINSKLKELETKQQEKQKEEEKKKEETNKNTTAMNTPREQKILLKSDIRVINGDSNSIATVNTQYIQERDYLSNPATFSV